MMNLDMVIGFIIGWSVSALIRWMSGRKEEDDKTVLQQKRKNWR
jgi:hypothetical protein